MPTYTRGAVEFEVKELPNTTELSQEEKVFEVSCAPPPKGTIARFNPTLKIGPQVVKDFLQADESNRLQQGAKKAGEASVSVDTILAELGAAVGFRTLDIDLKGIDPTWEQPVACFTTTVTYVVEGSTWEVTAKTTTGMASGGATYPAGDAIADFRVWVPKRYKFIRRYRWNPDCCPALPGPDRNHASDESGWWPFEVHIDLPPEWKWKPDWKLGPGWDSPYYPLPKAKDEPPQSGGDHH